MSSPYTTHEYAGQPLYLSFVTPYFFIALQISCFPIDQFWLNEIPARRHLRQRKRMLTFPCDLRGTTFLPTVDIRAAISETCLKALQAQKPHCTPQEPTPFTISCTYTQEEPWETFPSAANDPIFWLHHSFVDRILEKWLRKYKANATVLSKMGAPIGHNRRDPIVPLFPIRTHEQMFKKSWEFGNEYEDVGENGTFNKQAPQKNIAIHCGTKSNVITDLVTISLIFTCTLFTHFQNNWKADKSSP